MASPGDSFPVGSNAPETGQYRHSACGDTAIFNKGNNFAPCSKVSCPNRGANWVLVKILT